MLAFFMDLLEQAMNEIEVEPQDIQEAEIECSGGSAVWSVLIGNQEVFFMHGHDGTYFPYHTNCYDEPHPDYCLCDECARDRFAYCGYED